MVHSLAFDGSEGRNAGCRVKYELRGVIPFAISWLVSRGLIHESLMR